MKVFIKTKEGESLVTGVKSHHTIRDLKRKVAHSLSIAVRQQRLVFAGEELQDDKTIQQYNIQNTALIHLVIRQRVTNHPREQTKRETIQQPDKEKLYTNSDSTFDIFVQVTGGAEQKKLITGVKGSDQIRLLKECTSRVTGWPVEDQRLLFGGKELENSRSIEEYRIESGYTIQMAIKVKGG